MIKEIVERWHEENFTMIDEVAQAALIAKLEREFIARTEVAAALGGLQRDLITDARAEATWGSGTKEDTIKRHFNRLITKLGLAPGKDESNA